MGFLNMHFHRWISKSHILLTLGVRNASFTKQNYTSIILLTCTISAGWVTWSIHQEKNVDCIALVSLDQTWHVNFVLLLTSSNCVLNNQENGLSKMWIWFAKKKRCELEYLKFPTKNKGRSNILCYSSSTTHRWQGKWWAFTLVLVSSRRNLPKLGMFWSHQHHWSNMQYCLQKFLGSPPLCFEKENDIFSGRPKTRPICIGQPILYKPNLLKLLLSQSPHNHSFFQ